MWLRGSKILNADVLSAIKKLKLMISLDSNSANSESGEPASLQCIRHRYLEDTNRKLIDLGLAADANDEIAVYNGNTSVVPQLEPVNTAPISVRVGFNLSYGRVLIREISVPKCNSDSELVHQIRLTYRIQRGIFRRYCRFQSLQSIEVCEVRLRFARSYKPALGRGKSSSLHA